MDEIKPSYSKHKGLSDKKVTQLFDDNSIFFFPAAVKFTIFILASAFTHSHDKLLISLRFW